MTAPKALTNYAGIGSANDPANSLQPNLDSALAVTKSDSTVFNPPLLALYVGGTGDVAVRMFKSQTTVTFSAVPAGALLPIKVDKVMSTNTTATLVLGLY